MNIKSFKPLHDNNCYIAMVQSRLFDVTIPKYSIAYYHNKEHTLYICTHFPNYTGKVENVRLNVLWYDLQMGTIGETTVQRCDVSIALYNAWLNASKPKTRKIYHEIDYEKLMYAPPKKKKATGGVRLSEKTDAITLDSIKYKQNTVYAYYENLYDAKSGNASMIASNYTF